MSRTYFYNHENNYEVLDGMHDCSLWFNVKNLMLNLML